MSKSVEMFEPHKASDVERAGFLLFLGGMEIILMMTVAEALYPGYSTHTNTISDLAAVGSPTWTYFDPAVFVWGLCWLLGAYLLLRGAGRRGLLVMNMLPGLGVILAALSPENVNVAIHSIGAIIAFIPGGLTVLLSYRLIASRLRYFAVFLGSVSLVAIAVYFGAYYSALVQETLGSGGAERVIVYPMVIWLVGFGSYLLTVRKPAESSQ
jgi:hypothetical membrane protein